MLYDFEVVQCPINVFDRRMCETGKLEELKSNGILKFMPDQFSYKVCINVPGNLSPCQVKFDKWINLINEWNKY